MRALVHEIRDRGGAREIHLRVACPPIIAPCYYGIDMSRKDELFATSSSSTCPAAASRPRPSRRWPASWADSLRYLPVEAIARSVSLSPERLCRACITGQYPTATGQYLYQIEALVPAQRRPAPLRAGPCPALSQARRLSENQVKPDKDLRRMAGESIFDFSEKTMSCHI